MGRGRKTATIKSLPPPRKDGTNSMVPEFRKMKVIVWGGRYPDARGCGTYSLWHWLTSHTLPIGPRPHNHASLYGRHNVSLSENIIAELGTAIHYPPPPPQRNIPSLSFGSSKKCLNKQNAQFQCIFSFLILFLSLKTEVILLHDYFSNISEFKTAVAGCHVAMVVYDVTRKVPCFYCTTENYNY